MARCSRSSPRTSRARLYGHSVALSLGEDLVAPPRPPRGAFPHGALIGVYMLVYLGR